MKSRLTVSSMTVAVLVDVVLRDGLSPSGATFKLDVLDVDTSVHNKGGNTLATMAVIDVLAEGAEA